MAGRGDEVPRRHSNGAVGGELRCLPRPRAGALRTACPRYLLRPLQHFSDAAEEGVEADDDEATRAVLAKYSTAAEIDAVVQDRLPDVFFGVRGRRGMV